MPNDEQPKLCDKEYAIASNLYARCQRMAGHETTATIVPLMHLNSDSTSWYERSTPMPNDEQQREVAAFYLGWKPGQMCRQDLVTCRHPDEKWFNSEEDIVALKFAEHEIPPPDLTLPQNAWALLMALWKRGIYLSPAPFDGALYLWWDGMTKPSPLIPIDNDLIAALIQAAYQAITEGVSP